MYQKIKRGDNMSEKSVPVEVEIPKDAIKDLFRRTKKERVKEIVETLSEASDAEEALSQIIVKALEFYFYKKGKLPKPKWLN